METKYDVTPLQLDGDLGIQMPVDVCFRDTLKGYFQAYQRSEKTREKMYRFKKRTLKSLPEMR